MVLFGIHCMEETFSYGDAAASKTRPTQCSSLRKGGYVLLKGHPCKLVEKCITAPGKHGPAKAHLVGLDLFTGKKYEDICPVAHKVPVPIISKTEYQLLDVSGGYVSVLNDEGQVREDLIIPSGDLGQEMRKRFEEGQDLVLCVMTAMDTEAIISIKSAIH